MKRRTRRTSRAAKPEVAVRAASVRATKLRDGPGRLGRFFLKIPDAYSDEQLRKAAHLYYRDRLDQRAVADLMHVSQAKVARLLTVARQRGIVRFQVADYDPRDHRLERQIQKQYALNSVAVIKVPAGFNVEDTRRFVAHFGASFITSLIPPRSEVVVAGGRAIGELVQRLPEDHQRRVTVLQALGIVDSSLAHVDPLELGRTLARRWGGFFMTLNTPAVVSDKQTRDSLLRRSNTRSVWQRLGHAQAAIIAVGTPTNSTFANRYVVTTSDLAALMQRGAVGEICGRFFDQQGRECDSPWRDQVISIELEQLRKFPQVIALVVGRDRSAAVAAAIRGGLIKSLAIDVEGARGLLEN